MSKHTPGPWTVIESASGKPLVITDRLQSVRDIARTQDDEEGRANARLIAAAPELLEAAKLVLAWYEAEDDHSNTDFYERVEMCRESEAAVRAAILKATGEAS